MTKFLIFKFLLIITILFSLISCGKKKTEEEVAADNSTQFFKIVYITQAVRTVGSSAWTRVEGKQRFKFEHDDSNTATDNGNATIQYENYKEPILFQSSLCSGGYKGSFTLKEISASENTSGTCSTCPYNPIDPYVGDSTTTTNTTTTPEIDPKTGLPIPTNTYFLFSLLINYRSLAPGCSQVNPQDSFELRVIRFPNGDLIVTNQSRSLEFYVIPELL